MQVDPNTLPREDQRRNKKRWGLWFAAGFLAVFVFLSITVTMYTMRPSGDAVVACKLWQYYLTEIRRALTPSVVVVVPASGSRSATLLTLSQHLLISLAGGAAMMGLGWLVYKVKGR